MKRAIRSIAAAALLAACTRAGDPKSTASGDTTRTRAQTPAAQTPPAQAPTPQTSATESKVVDIGGRPRTTAVDMITMDRGACYRSCPIYSVSIAGNGAVRFDGQRNVKHTGAASGEVPQASIASLFRYLDEIGFASFDGSYTDGRASCGDYASDLPSVTVKVTRGGRSQTVIHDYGCDRAPRTLRPLHRMIDSLGGTQQWVGVP